MLSKKTKFVIFKKLSTNFEINYVDKDDLKINSHHVDECSGEVYPTFH